MKIGVVADMHGALPEFEAAVRLFDSEHVERVVCAGDIVDRGPEADTIVRTIQQGILNRIVEQVGAQTDVLILGHTHQPMRLHTGGLWILNPGSIYGVTIRDSHTCGILDLSDCAWQVYDVRSGERVETPLVDR